MKPKRLDKRVTYGVHYTDPAFLRQHGPKWEWLDFFPYLFNSEKEARTAFLESGNAWMRYRIVRITEVTEIVEISD